MPTDADDLRATIKEWANRQDWADWIVDGFIYLAEEKLNAELRIAQMIQFDDGLITSRCALLPPDWLAMDLVRVANENGADGFLPARYKSRDEFFNLTDYNSWMYYTIVGTQMFFGGTPNPVDGTPYKIVYYGALPSIFNSVVEGDNWLWQTHTSLYLYGSLMHASLHAVGEEQGAANFKQLTEDMIQKLNAAHLGAKASGSRVTMPRKRSFG